MPNIDKHATGSFNWIELATSDQGAAKNFYGPLFGWDPQDFPMGPDSYYTMFNLDGRNAAACYKQGAQEAGVPPHWNLYVAVDSADDAAKKAAELGGTVLSPPFDVMQFGRMSVIQDPSGAVFMIWQPVTHPGTGIEGVDGTLCWADLSTPHPEVAKPFYEGLFGWQIAPGENDPSGYLHIKNGSTFIGGVPPSSHRDPKMPPHWLLYFLVSDVDAATAKAKELGATVYMPPSTIENVGRWAVLADPQGAVFSVFTPMRRA